MGYDYTERVYKAVTDTSPTEQAVLAYIGHRADDATGQCYPRIVLIMAETRLSRAAVMRALDALRGKGVLRWVRGGRIKGGKAVSNRYTIALPPVDKPKGKKPKRKAVDNFKEDAREEETRVSQGDTAGSHRETMQGFTERPCRVSQRDPNIHIIDKEQPVSNITRPEGRVETGPGRYDLGGKRREGAVLFKELLGDVEAPPPSPRALSPVQEAMAAAGVTDKDNARVFSSVMMGRDPMRCLEEIHRFASERRQGEMANVRNLAALLVERLKAVG